MLPGKAGTLGWTEEDIRLLVIGVLRAFASVTAAGTA
jgi:hypothetical protein